MRQRLFNALAVVSLLLFVATVALWLRSYWKWDHCVWKWEEGVGAVVVERQRDVFSMHGSVGIQHIAQEPTSMK